jgi:HD-like signal output (HDOD) protein
MSLMRPINIAKVSSQLFTLPDVCVRIRSILNDGRSDLKDINRFVTLALYLLPKALGLANSPLFRFESHIDLLAKAFNIIGSEALYKLIMTETARTAFQRFSSDIIDLKEFWLQTINPDLVTTYIEQYVVTTRPRMFFLFNLLHN